MSNRIRIDKKEMGSETRALELAARLLEEAGREDWVLELRQLPPMGGAAWVVTPREEIDRGYVGYRGYLDLAQLRARLARRRNAADPDAEQVHGLHQVARVGNLEALRALLDLGLDVDARDREGDTALAYAADHGQVAAAEELIRRSASVDSANTIGCTPLHFAANRGQTRVVELLLSKGAGPDPRLVRAASTPLHLAVFSGDQESVRLLLAAGADRDAHDMDGFTSLHHSLRLGRPEIAHALLDAGARVDRAAKDGTLPLAVAAASGNITVVEAILRAGAPLNASDGEGFTALHLAALEADARTLAVLLDRGGDPTARGGPSATTVLQLAASGWLFPPGDADALHRRVLGPLDPRTPTVHPFPRPDEDRRIAAIEACLARVDVDAKDAEGRTALDYAVSRGLSRVVDRLTLAGARCR